MPFGLAVSERNILINPARTPLSCTGRGSILVKGSPVGGLFHSSTSAHPKDKKSLIVCPIRSLRRAAYPSSRIVPTGT